MVFSMPRKSVSNTAWIEEKQDNFLNFLLGSCDKYQPIFDASSMHASVVDTAKNFVQTLKDDETRRAIMFSTLARKQMAESSGLAQASILAAKTFWEKGDGEKTQGYVEAVDFLRTVHKELGNFIEYLNDNQDTVLPDLDKLAGYTSLFFGDFIKNT